MGAGLSTKDVGRRLVCFVITCVVLGDSQAIVSPAFFFTDQTVAADNYDTIHTIIVLLLLFTHIHARTHSRAFFSFLVIFGLDRTYTRICYN